MVISPVPECIIGINILNSPQNLHNGSISSKVKVIMVGKARWKPPELPLPGKIVLKRIPEEIADISATIKDLERCRGGDYYYITGKL